MKCSLNVTFGFWRVEYVETNRCIPQGYHLVCLVSQFKLLYTILFSSPASNLITVEDFLCQCYSELCTRVCIDNKHSTQQECIPVGCVPPAFYRTGGLCSGRGLCITLAQTSFAGGNYIYNVTHKDTQKVLKHILVLEFLEI